MRCLVTGGAGFIGSHLVDALLLNNYRVRVIDNLSTGNINNLKNINKLDFWHADLLDNSIVNKACKNIDCVFHLAAVINPKADNYTIIQNGEIITLKLLESAVKYKTKKFIFASSAAVYGENTRLNEEATPQPLNNYGHSKYVCEKIISTFSQAYFLDSIILRYFNVFGPRQKSGVIPIFIKNLKANITPVIFGSGLQSRDFVYISNIINANLLAMNYNQKLPSEIFNVGCGKNYSINYIFKLIANLLHSNIKPVYKLNNTQEINFSQANINKIKQILKYKPETNLLEGLKLLICKNKMPK